MRSIFYTNHKYLTNYYINQELYNRINDIKTLINYHASKKVMEFNLNSIYDINNTNINERIELKRKYKQICLLSNKIKKNKDILDNEELKFYTRIITDMENILLEMTN